MGKAKATGASKKTVEKKREKVVEDKTFGLKNKNKSKKVQQYIQQVTANSKTGGKSQAFLDAEAAKKKKEKELKKQAEREMALLLGEAYALDKKKEKKKKKKEAEQAAANEEEEKAAQQMADEKDFGTPIAQLRDVFGQGGKVVVERVCVDMVWKDNLPGKAPGDGSPCLFVRVNDGTTLNPMTMAFLGETPSTFPYKVNTILDVRNVVAMLRGDKVFLEVPKGAQGTSSATEGVECSVEAASERLSEYIREKIQEEEDIRARGGIPIEERIEEERALLKPPLTPVTKERFFEWKEKRRKLKEEEAENKMKEAQKKGSKAILSGRALFHMDRSLFVDDDTTTDVDYSTREEVENINSATAGYSESDDDDEDDDAGASAQPPGPPGDEALAKGIQEKLYLEGDDDDLDDLDDDDDDDDDDE